MATKREVKAIINSKKLTGQDAARLIMRHLWEEDHGRPGILTEAEIQQLRSNVSRLSLQDVEDYDSWMHLYRIIAFTLIEAERLSLEIHVTLQTASALLERTLLAWRLRMEQHRRPTIVTQKQFEELKARWREHQLQRLHCLSEVIYRRMAAKDATAFEAEDDEALYRLRHESAAEIEELIASGQLEPVELEIKADDDRLKRYHFNREQAPEGGENVEWHPAYYADHVPPEEVDRLCRSYLSGEQLYQAGLPEWQEEIDEYDHPRAAEALDLPEAEHGMGVAVIQEPMTLEAQQVLRSFLDDEGHYHADDLVELTFLPALEQLFAEDGESYKRRLRQYHTNVRRQLRVFLAHRPILEALSEVIGFRIDEDLQKWLERIQRAAEAYNHMLEVPAIAPVAKEDRWIWPQRWLDRKPELPSFTIDDLEPDPERVQHLKERMSLALGEDCYQAFREWLTEMCQEIDEVEDRLAEELSDDEEAH